ncbi:hypothetical protein ACFCYB_12155 [Streptomyces sp. NPDC056309]|uniref:8-oxoguanine DNA glycosylase OGG fold protein n=1 Tax=unclassified Streptomyces TaxID=2593676 RepID=UPI0035E29ADA
MRWLSLLPDPTWWSAELDDCPMVAARPPVDRATVFRMARRSGTAEGRRHLLTAALVWGTGTRALSVARRARVFEESSAEDIEARLKSALATLQEQGAVGRLHETVVGHGTSQGNARGPTSIRPQVTLTPTSMFPVPRVHDR